MQQLQVTSCVTEYSGPSLKVCICNNAAERVSSGVLGGNSNLDILASIKHTEQVHVNTSCLHKLNSIQNDLIALTTTYRNIHNKWKEVSEHDITSLINLSAKEGTAGNKTTREEDELQVLITNQA